jgi:hypothetical protein
MGEAITPTKIKNFIASAGFPLLNKMMAFSALLDFFFKNLISSYILSIPIFCLMLFFY